MATQQTFRTITTQLAKLVILHGHLFRNSVPEHLLPNKYTATDQIKQRVFIREVVKHLQTYVIDGTIDYEKTPQGETNGDDEAPDAGLRQGTGDMGRKTKDRPN